MHSQSNAAKQRARRVKKERTWSPSDCDSGEFEILGAENLIGDTGTAGDNDSSPEKYNRYICPDTQTALNFPIFLRIAILSRVCAAGHVWCLLISPNSAKHACTYPCQQKKSWRTYGNSFMMKMKLPRSVGPVKLCRILYWFSQRAGTDH